MISIPILIAFISVFATWLAVSYWRKNYKIPPGPWGLPFFGYYPFLTNEHFKDFANLAKRYGNVFSFTTVGGKLIVVVNGIDLIKEVLVKRSDEFIGKPLESNLNVWISEMGIAQEEGAVWKEHRRFFLQTAKNFGFGKQESEELVQEEIKGLIDDVKKEATGQPVNMRLHITYTVSSIVSRILFSKKFDKYNAFPEIAEGAYQLLKMLAELRYLLVGPFYEHVVMKFFPSTSKTRKARILFHKVMQDLVEEHVKTFDPEHLRDYIDGYLYQAYKLDQTGEKHSYTIDRLVAICLNMLMEGTESATLCGLLDTASEHPEEQKKVQEEIDAVIGRERMPSWVDKQKLPLLEAFIQELYRHNMAFKISTQYCNYEETTIQGYRIPQRSIIIANLWSINNDPELYPEPTKFDPKRFIDDNGKKIITQGPYPFGIGKRSCVGESLAQKEVFLIIASLLQNFTIHPADKSGYMRVLPRQ